jgi:hypothetical protein
VTSEKLRAISRTDRTPSRKTASRTLVTGSVGPTSEELAYFSRRSDSAGLDATVSIRSAIETSSSWQRARFFVTVPGGLGSAAIRLNRSSTDVPIVAVTDLPEGALDDQQRPRLRPVDRRGFGRLSSNQAR